LKNPITKNWDGGAAQGEGPEFKPEYCKKKKKRKEKGVPLLFITVNLLYLVIYYSGFDQVWSEIIIHGKSQKKFQKQKF
jgi:hypothetical protein